ncbi:KpsF/GutQ family sugar-phosphate isomerase [Pseudoalteromonas sp. C2R02]|uniref:KpsF/GutQ family sugar-phosphate isomerase n=1 Tax=Pseudoalteromonas sp. C2R02 TaxID=2841565 RepID=UPI001C09BCBB|nr:KpsF/GutQ family sugar-phosphate isomerase [Pseudoalteromonas sp. C2R02]MBU2968126.1 KpsF/GutQ family sugar-phosphate isomerase [Pseudoalteromonas sp. C2R02]
MSLQDFITRGKQVLAIEKQAINQLEQYIDQNFQNACQLMFDCTGRIIVIGMGKSGHIGNKIAATLASTGTPSFFVHPGEASHGDLGMITSQDVVILISNSGETSEVINIIPVLKRIGAKMVSMSGNIDSSLAKLSDVHVCIKVEQEACPLGLAPTASTTATLVMGDAFAVALLEARGFTADDFALSHPGGSLGKRLLLTLKDIMHSGIHIPIVKCDDIIKDALIEMSEKGLGMTAIVNSKNQLQGIFTDGDLRRILEQKIDIHNTKISDVMTTQCTTVNPDMLAAQALNIMENKRINGLLVVNESQQPIGALNMQDLLKAGVF